MSVPGGSEDERTRTCTTNKSSDCHREYIGDHQDGNLKKTITGLTLEGKR